MQNTSTLKNKGIGLAETFSSPDMWVEIRSKVALPRSTTTFGFKFLKGVIGAAPTVGTSYGLLSHGTSGPIRGGVPNGVWRTGPNGTSIYRLPLYLNPVEAFNAEEEAFAPEEPLYEENNRLFELLAYTAPSNMWLWQKNLDGNVKRLKAKKRAIAILDITVPFY